MLQAARRIPRLKTITPVCSTLLNSELGARADGRTSRVATDSIGSRPSSRLTAVKTSQSKTRVSDFLHLLYRFMPYTLECTGSVGQLALMHSRTSK